MWRPSATTPAVHLTVLIILCGFITASCSVGLFPPLAERRGGIRIRHDAAHRAQPSISTESSGLSATTRKDSLTLRIRGGGLPLPLASGAMVSEGKAKVKLSINYGVEGGSIVAVGPNMCFGNGDIHKAPKLQRKGGELWEGEIEVNLCDGVLHYQYVVLAQTHRYEARIADRSLSLIGLKDGDTIFVQDAFRSPKPATLATSCFADAIFGKGHKEADVATENKDSATSDITWRVDGAGEGVTVRFTVFAPRKEAGHSIWITGAPESMGKWSDGSRVPMVHVGRGIFVGQATVPKSEVPFEYKYVILDAAGNVACKEKDPRKATVADQKFVVRDEAFNYPTPNFGTSGVSIPVASIKTKDSTGIGEFLDLNKVVDWCVKTGMQIIQILPINDSGEDPSPYSAASSFALHPSYLRPSAICKYYAEKMGLDMSGQTGWAQSLVDKLNGNWKIDHPKILDEKRRITEAIFDQVGQDKVMGDADMKAWIEANRPWLDVYAAFKVQLNKEKGFNNKWFDCTTWGKKAGDRDSILRSDDAQVARVYFVQYHLHLQLLEASKYAAAHGVAIKGDLPIGVTRCSSDVWAEPQLFKLDKNCGAPGNPEQNWGFPPYNWDAMHRDGCSWWRRRLAHMEQYFHAYRIDHVLGFFRMWEIPQHGQGGSYCPNGGLREQGLRNLRAIQTASNMMICGEDLGNVPPEVGPVLLELGILGLKIQRWCDGKTDKYGYLTVAASSCHDCSPCRLWWNENWGEAEHFFYTHAGGGGQCPGGPPDWISQKIIKMHCESSALVTINPIQDLIDMWSSLRSKDAKNDMINKPGSTDGCWIWRCHKSMEDLLSETKFNDFCKKMNEDAKRGRAY